MTPTVQTHNNNNNNSLVGGAKPGSVAGQPGDRMALMTFSDQVTSSEFWQTVYCYYVIGARSAAAQLRGGAEGGGQLG